MRYLIIFCCILLVACKKDLPTIATITVRNDAGQPVPGATVILRGEGDEPKGQRFNLSLVTDGTGKATYDFTDYYKDGQSGFAVLNIEVYKGNLEGEGLIKVEGEANNEELVVIE